MSRQPQGRLGAGDSVGRSSDPEPAANLMSPQFRPPLQVWAPEGCPAEGEAAAPSPWLPGRTPHPLPGSAASRREGVNLRPPGLPPNQAQAAGSPACGPRRDPLAPHPPASLPSRRPAFICSQGADSQRTTPGPAPACDAARLLRAGCKSPDRPQSGPRARVPHPRGRADSGRCV